MTTPCQRFVCTLLLGAAPCTSALAADFCVGTSNELSAALFAASANDQADDIRLRAGVFVVPGGGFTYQAATSDLNDSLVFTGGWNEACDGVDDEAKASILDGWHAEEVLQFAAGSKISAALVVRSLEVLNGAGLTGGLRVRQFADISIEAVTFHGNDGVAAGAFSIIPTGRLHFANNLVVGNAKASQVTLGGDALLLNNTFVGSTAPGYEQALIIAAQQTQYRALLQNNIFENDASAVKTSIVCFTTPGDAPAVKMVSNAIDGSFCEDAIVEDALVGKPVFDTGYRLQTGNELIDAGNAVIDSFLAPWKPLLPATDIYGQTRRQGVEIDPGAAERPAADTIMFIDSFEG